MKVKIFLDEVAVQVGVEKAIILQMLDYYIDLNRKNERNFHNGHYWTYNSAKAWAQLLPFWNARKVAKLLRELEADGYIITDQLNKAEWDRTKWYALTERYYCILDDTKKCNIEGTQSGQSNIHNLDNRMSKKCNIDSTQSGHSSINTVIDNSKERSSKAARVSKKFVKPTFSQLKDYFFEKNHPEPETAAKMFLNYYESVDWHVGKKRMKDWRAAVRNWILREKDYKPKKKTDDLFSEEAIRNRLENWW